MPDSLSVAIGTVLSVLEIVETKFGVIEDVNLVQLNDHPTNIIEFTLGDQRYEVLVTQRPPSNRMPTTPSIHSVELGARKQDRRKRGRKTTSRQLTLT